MRLLIAFAAATMLFAGVAKAETVRILMETVPDTRYIQELLPEFEEATGIDVEIEAISYIDMHSKLVPQLIASQGSYDLIVVDFYWVGEFTKAGWLMPLDDLVARDGVDIDVYVPKLMDLVGRVDGTLYMLPFYNYSMGGDLSPGPDRRSRRAGEFQGKIRNRSQGPRDLGRVLEAGRILHARQRRRRRARLLRNRHPGPARGLHLDAVGELSLFPGGPLSRRELESPAGQPRGHPGHGVLPRPPW